MVSAMVSELDKQTYTSEFESHWMTIHTDLWCILAKSLVNYYSLPSRQVKLEAVFNYQKSWQTT